VREQICDQVRYFHDLLPFIEEVAADADDSPDASPGGATRG
jgi:hypothetical protein